MSELEDRAALAQLGYWQDKRANETVEHAQRMRAVYAHELVMLIKIPLRLETEMGQAHILRIKELQSMLFSTTTTDHHPV